MGFYVGLMAVITPPVFPLLFLHTFLQLRLENNDKTFKLNLRLYSFCLIFFYSQLSSLFIYTLDSTYIRLDRSLYFINLFPIAAILLVGIAIWEIIDNSKKLLKYRFIIVIFLALHLLFCSLSNTGPLLGSVLSETNILMTLRIIIPFSIGLLIPFIFLSVILRFLSKDKKQTKLWKYIQIIGLLWFVILNFKNYLFYL